MKREFQKKHIPEIAHDIITQSKKVSQKSAAVITLSGELGAGKTTLTQEIARQLGIKENLVSPTFVILKRYKTTDKTFTHLIHIDAYRLNSGDELLRLGFAELLEDPKNLIIIEWPEKVPTSIPGHAFPIELTHIDEDNREINY